MRRYGHKHVPYGSPGLDGSLSDKAELLAHLLEREAIDHAKAAMVGDRKHDIQAARAETPSAAKGDHLGETAFLIGRAAPHQRLTCIPSPTHCASARKLRKRLEIEPSTRDSRGHLSLILVRTRTTRMQAGVDDRRQERCALRRAVQRTLTPLA